MVRFFFVEKVDGFAGKEEEHISLVRKMDGTFSRYDMEIDTERKVLMSKNVKR